jgi:nicotinic acid mononucleotide adenylyltransferase
MLCFHGRPGSADVRRVVVLPAAYNPPTIAHFAMAERLAKDADEVLFLLPEQMPHKQFEDASHEERLHMLAEIAQGDCYRVCSAADGLFVNIASACRSCYPEAEIAIACGRDAAERVLAWDYADPSTVETLFALAELWVFARQGSWNPPGQWKHRVKTLPFPDDLQQVSATEVRERIAAGQAWQHLVPSAIHALVERIYASR